MKKKLGVLIIDDITELQDLIWPDIVKILIHISTYKDYQLRNPATYGIGIFAGFTKNDFKTYENDLLNSIINAMTFSDNISRY